MNDAQQRSTAGAITSGHTGSEARTASKLTPSRLAKFGHLVLMRLRFGPNRLNENIEDAAYAIANVAVEQAEIHPSQIERFYAGVCHAAYARHTTSP